jgi:hypothetical protein
LNKGKREREIGNKKENRTLNYKGEETYCIVRQPRRVKKREGRGRG